MSLISLFVVLSFLIVDAVPKDISVEPSIVNVVIGEDVELQILVQYV